MIAGIETGGTTVRWAVADADPIRPSAVGDFPTTSPEEVVARAADGIRAAAAGEVSAVGIAGFGPLDLDPASPGYGTVLATPKPGWRGAPLLRLVAEATGARVALDTDVGAAVRAEWRWGAGRGFQDVCYVTVGTGVGVGAIVGGTPLRGHRAGHPELGHLLVRRRPEDDFPGVCPFHRDCLEGLASGPALSERWGLPAEELGSGAPEAIRVEAFYLAQLVAVLAYTLAPAVVVLGGGVAHLPGLHEAVGTQAAAVVGEALPGRAVSDPRSGHVRAPRFAGSGLIGALTMAHDVGQDLAHHCDDRSSP